MAPGLTLPLFGPALVVALLGYVVLRRHLSFAPAVLVAGVRVLVPLVYFSSFPLIWTFSDDLAYLHQAAEMQRLGYGPLTALLPDGVVRLGVVAGSTHILYGWYNLLAITVFSPHYHAPVLLNVLMTFVAAAFLSDILRELEFGERYRRGCVVFFLLHWDLVVWTSFLNLKDVLIMTLTILALRLLFRLRDGVRVRDLLALVVIFVLFSALRFYVPILLLAAFVGWLLLGWPGRRKWFLVALAGAVGLLIVPWGTAAAYVRPAGIAVGLVRFLLTPRPWAIDPGYSFLLFASIAHWVLVVPALVAGVLLWRSSPGARLPLLYFFLVLLLYALVPDAQGPRRRVQATFILAWMQFHFLWLLVHGAVAWRRGGTTDATTSAAVP